jgi:hypothetical protein
VIEIIQLTTKGWDYANSRSNSNRHPELWAVIRWLGRNGGKSSNDKIITMVFRGDERAANKAIGELKQRNIVVGE